MNADPVACSRPLVLHFLWSQLDQGKGVSTIRVYVSAISVFHGGTDGLPLGRHRLVCQFLKGARRLCPSHTLQVVLKCLTKALYEPLLT